MPGVVTYIRVSTVKQGQSGLGLDAQRAAVASYAPVREFVEIETGKNNNRAQLGEAMRYCRIHRCTLVIAKLDRLSRNAAFLLNLLDSAGFEITAADMPQANRMVLGIMAVVAQEEAAMISRRTSAALQAKIAQGAKLGGDRGGRATAAAVAAGHASQTISADRRAADIFPIIREIQAGGIVSHNAIAKALFARLIPKARGGLNWTNTDVRRLLARADMIS